MFSMSTVVVALMDSLDSTFDRDTKPGRPRLNDESKPISRLNDDMHTIAVSPGPQQTVTNHDDHNEEDDDDKSSYAFDCVDSAPPRHNKQNNITSITQIEDDGSENKITDTTMKGAIGKTASGKKNILYKFLCLCWL